MKKKLNLRRSTCFGTGVAGAAANLLAGVLMAAGVGAAQYAQTAGFVFYGAMLLLLGVTERGPNNTSRRVRLLLLFFLLMAALPRLPLLDLVEIAVLPLAAALYRKKGDGPFLLALVLAEAVYAAVRTLALVPRWMGSNALLAVGVALIGTGLARGAVWLRQYILARRSI